MFSDNQPLESDTMRPASPLAVTVFQALAASGVLYPTCTSTAVGTVN
jgi:hypothetical protein